MEPQGKKQIERTRIAEVERARVWSILMDSTLLPRWVPAVRHVDACERKGERVGAVRECSVELGGRAGTMVERCVSLEPDSHVHYAVEDESFGLRRMFDHYTFRISLTPRGPQRTEVKVETFYTPRHAGYALLNAVMLRRRFASVVDGLLEGLVRLAEEAPDTAEPAPTAPRAS